MGEVAGLLQVKKPAYLASWRFPLARAQMSGEAAKGWAKQA